MADGVIVVQLRRRDFGLGAAAWAAALAVPWQRNTQAAAVDATRLVSWNLRNYSGSATATSEHAPGHDNQRLHAHLEDIAADVYCFQEVQNPAALAAILPGYDLQISEHGGRHDQYLVHACRHTLTPPRLSYSDHRLDNGGALRPALVSFATFGEQTWTIIGVHLKATPSGLPIRTEQWRHLADLVRELPAPRIVAGDFNTATGPSEIASLAKVLSSCGLEHVPPTRPCSAYWEGRRRDSWKQPSTLDHVFIESRADRPAPWVQAAPGTHCRSHGCESFASSDAYPDLDYERVSDHCPLLVDIPRQR